MKTHGVGSLPVVSDLASARLEGIVTDRDLCCSIVAEAKLVETTKIANVMTRNPMACAAENTLEDCENLMQKYQIRKVPVVDDKGRCVGIVAQADIAAHATVAEIARTLVEISKHQKGRTAVVLEATLDDGGSITSVRVVRGSPP